MSKNKRIISYCIVFFMCISFFIGFKESYAATSYSQVSSTTNINSDYSFSPRFISGVSSLEGFGGNSYESDLWRYWKKNGTWTYEELNKNSYYPIRLKDSLKGKVGAWYRNVGEYKGQMLDLKVTIMDWSDLRSKQIVKNKNSYPCIVFHKKRIRLDITEGYVKKVKYKYEIYNKSGSKVNINGHITFKDVDAEQYYSSADFSRGYLAKGSPLKVNSNQVTAPNNSLKNEDINGWSTVLINNKSTFNILYSALDLDKESYAEKRTNRYFYTFSFDGDSLAPFTTPVPTKSATSVVHKGDNITYTIKFTVPQQPSNYLYTKFQIKDVLPKGVKYKSFSVVNDEGSNVTNLFSGNISGQTFTASVSKPKSASFYYKTYTMTINCVADSSYDFSIGNNGSKTLVSNTATITSKAGSRAEESKNSNTVSTEIRYKITTSTDGNGTITNSLDSIVGGSDKTISYSPKPGYKVNEIIVDGTKVDGG